VPPGVREFAKRVFKRQTGDITGGSKTPKSHLSISCPIMLPKYSLPCDSTPPAGEGCSSITRGRSFVYRSSMKALPSMPGDDFALAQSVAYGINDAGQIITDSMLLNPTNW